MAKDPAFLFYSQDFLVGVMTMSFEDRGKYITILAMMHQQGRMSEETIRLLVGSFSDTLRLKFSVDENGLFFNKRLEEETEKRNNFTKSRRDNGLKGGRPKNNKPSGKPKKNLMDNHKGNLMGNENENENENEIIKLKSTEFKNIKITEPEYDRLVKDFTQATTDKAIKYLSEYKIEKGYKTKSDNLTIRRWVIDAVTKQNQNGKKDEPPTRTYKLLS